METIYTLTGWVRKVINNENARPLEEIHFNAVGDVGRDTLVRIAANWMEVWKSQYPNRKRKYPIAYTCSVFSNKVGAKSSITERDQTIFFKLVKTDNKK